jgi:hypothetical protein
LEPENKAGLSSNEILPIRSLARNTSVFGIDNHPPTSANVFLIVSTIDDAKEGGVVANRTISPISPHAGSAFIPKEDSPAPMLSHGFSNPKAGKAQNNNVLDHTIKAP